MSDDHTPDDLRALGERLNKARRDRMGTAAGDGKSDGASNGALGLGFRIGLELVVAVMVGVGVGWVIDQWLGTRPWAMIVCLFLGFAAGLLTVYRAMNALGPVSGQSRPASGRETEDDED